MSDSAGTMNETQTDDADGDDEHLGEIPDGAGCVEIWEKISENRSD